MMKRNNAKVINFSGKNIRLINTVSDELIEEIFNGAEYDDKYIYENSMPIPNIVSSKDKMINPISKYKIDDNIEVNVYASLAIPGTRNSNSYMIVPDFTARALIGNDEIIDLLRNRGTKVDRLLSAASDELILLDDNKNYLAHIGLTPIDISNFENQEDEDDEESSTDEQWGDFDL